MAQTLIKTKLNLIPLKYKSCAVVVGKTGVGKSVLIGGLCRSNENFRNTVVHGDVTFCLIDSPGIDTLRQTPENWNLLRNALTAKCINTIFVIIKYDFSLERMLEDFNEIRRLMGKFSTRFVVMVSHWDAAQEPNEDFRKICSSFENICSNVIFYSMDSPKNDLAGLMYGCICHMSRDKLTISDEEFSKWKEQY
ncbi:unnamed protein product [Adineta ricciae]|uniref:AIG1-type G domain-containing protein n=1 Tax=Adineta ricciae TaxID=249248 RepID=A0A815RIN4_ADIRI|nr:unnamed protein product [Adineta ricciae]CAF1572380.1 unnamed protein product [Adineta ricciae]